MDTGREVETRHRRQTLRPTAAPRILALRSVDGPVPTSDLDVLTPAEREHAGNYTSRSASHLYIAARALARRVLARAQGCDPLHVPIRQRCATCSAADHGSLRLAGDDSIGISVAHTRGAVAVCVAPNPVGVDIEHAPAESERQRIAPLDAWRMSTLAAPERAHLARVDRQAQMEWFLCTWTAKEAWTKARRTTIDDALHLDMSRVADALAAGPVQQHGEWFQARAVELRPGRRVIVTVCAGTPEALPMRMETDCGHDEPGHDERH